jgi:hypothetical protein
VKAIIIIVLAIAIFGGAGYATYKLFIEKEQALKLEKSLPPPPPPPDPTVPEFEKIVALRKSGKMLQARDAFYAFIEQYPESTKAPEAKDHLGNINTQIYLTPFPSPDKEIYVVKPGDVVDRVARHMKISGEMIVRANGLKATSNRGVILQIGQKLSFPRLDLSLLISRKQDKVIVLNKGRFFKWYPILQWPPQLAKKPATGKAAVPLPKLEGKIGERRAFFNGTPITYVDLNYAQATHWVQISGIAHATLHSILDEKAEGRPPGGGIVLPPKAVEEIAALVSKGDPVTLE